MKIGSSSLLLASAVAACVFISSGARAADEKPATARILTPKPGPAPHINGPKIFGVRPGSPFLYTIPATGTRPITFSVDNLPNGLTLDASTGQITGTLTDKGDTQITFHAKNAVGEDSRPFKIVVGDTISLTPPMGWNSWNCWAAAVDRQKVLDAAKVMSEKGLINHGWTYVNIDDTWQGQRGGEFNGILPNEKFPDMKGLADQIHAMGLKIGIYSTPWITSYAGFVGGSSNETSGEWTKEANGGPNAGKFRQDGRHLFAKNDAQQWAAWGIDYLKYDWNPKSPKNAAFVPTFKSQVFDMADALKASGRDIIYSYSNSMPFEEIATVAPGLNAWRTTGDINDSWFRLADIGFTQNKWAPNARPGHWNDPDMLEVGYVGKSANLHPTKLTPDEQYTHISLWCLLSAPLLIGCDMTRMDDFTFSLLTNDEVIDVDQDALGKSATLVSEEGEVSQERPGRNGAAPTIRKFSAKQVWAKQLDDGSYAVGLFNVSEKPAEVTAKWSDLKITGNYIARDLWQQKDLGPVSDQFSAQVNPHGCVFIKLRKAD